MNITKISLAAALAFSLSAPSLTAQKDQTATLNLKSQSRTASVDLSIQSNTYSYAFLFAGRGLKKPIRTSVGNYYLDPTQQLFVGMVRISPQGTKLRLTMPGFMTVGLQSILADKTFTKFKCSSYNRITFTKQKNGKTMGAVFYKEQNGNGSAQVQVEAKQNAKVEIKVHGTRPVGLRRPWWGGPWLTAFMQEFNLTDCYSVYVDGLPMGTIPDPCP